MFRIGMFSVWALWALWTAPAAPVQASEAPAAADTAAVDPAPADTASADPAPADTVAHFEIITDRWRDIQPPPYELNVEGHWYDPYNRNVLKGDYPIAGQNTFLLLTLTADNRFQTGVSPRPSGISTENPDSPDFFGDDGRLFYTGYFVFNMELYHGDTAFRPRDWELRFEPVFNVNVLHLQENNNVHINPGKGTDRNDSHLGIQGLSLEKHLFDLSPRYDFVSAKAGIQRYGHDFRNFLFFDDNLALRLFGTAANNRLQFNLIAFDLIEKEANSELNTVFEMRDQRVLAANIYRQDTFTKGYTAQLSLLHSQDRGLSHENTNGVPVRPSVFGAATVRDVDATYLGWAGDGHFGRTNITHQLYVARGTDQANAISGGEADIAAWFGALELSVDKDWKRFKVAALFASGDDDPYDDKAQGFDAVLDEAFFAGGPLGWWNQNDIRIMGTNLTNPRSFFPNLRSSKTESQANFVNPGIWLANVGFDAEVTPKWKASVNVSYLSFVNTAVLEATLNQPDIGSGIGVDASLGLFYRPFLNNQAKVFLGAAALFPGSGFNDIYESPGTQYTLQSGLVVAY